MNLTLHAREEELMARESHRAAGQQVLPVRSIFQRLLLRRKRTRAKRLRVLAAKATLPVRMIRPAWKEPTSTAPALQRRLDSRSGAKFWISGRCPRATGSRRRTITSIGCTMRGTGDVWHTTFTTTRFPDW